MYVWVMCMYGIYVVRFDFCVLFWIFCIKSEWNVVLFDYLDVQVMFFCNLIISVQSNQCGYVINVLNIFNVLEYLLIFWFSCLYSLLVKRWII